jgi:hypothetical protein
MISIRMNSARHAASVIQDFNPIPENHLDELSLAKKMVNKGFWML